MKDKLKIGITCYPTLGGSGVVATELGKLLAEKGHEVHFITHSMPFRLGKFHKNIFYHEVEVNDYYVFKYPPYDLSLASKLAQVAKMEELDLLACALCDSACGMCLACETNGWKHLEGCYYSSWNGYYRSGTGSIDFAILIRFAINESDAVTAVSKDLIQETRELLDIDRDIDLTYNFVDKRVYYPRDISKLKRRFCAAR